MTLQQLKYVIQTVECGSITEAARQLFIAQPSLSAAIKEVEAEMGITLFSRSTKGISLTADGTEFLAYARQIIEQTELLEQRYQGKKRSRQICSISTQHYAFAVNAFVNVLRMLPVEEYAFTLRETRTHEIIEDVKTLRSELGILYMSDFNAQVLAKILKESHLLFHPLFEAKPHVFISSRHPLSAREQVSLEDLDDYPFLAFEQGEYNSFYFSEEILSTAPHKKAIHVSDRATLFNCVIGLNGYTISTGVLNSDLNGEEIISVPLLSDERIRVGWIALEDARLSMFAQTYLAELQLLIAMHGNGLLQGCV